MSVFTEWLQISAWRDWIYWTLLKDYSFDVWYEGSSEKMVVPKWFMFEGASIPRIFRTLVGHPMTIKVLRAALIHDWLYITKKSSRKYADDVFYESMIISWVSKRKALLFYYMVRIFWWYVRYWY